VYRFGNSALVATVDFITPVCDEPARYGRVAAANSISDVYAMGGRPLFALNLLTIPRTGLSEEDTIAIMEGAARLLGESGAALLGGHSVLDNELKFGLAVIGEVAPDKVLSNAGAKLDQVLILTKPLGTGAYINGYRSGNVSAEALEPVLVEMERTNKAAAEVASVAGSTCATDVTGFGLGGHALEIAKASNVRLRIQLDRLPIHAGFAQLVEQGITTSATGKNAAYIVGSTIYPQAIDPVHEKAVVDPQTSGGLLMCVPKNSAAAAMRALEDSGHQGALIGEVIPGPVGLEFV